MIRPGIALAWTAAFVALVASAPAPGPRRASPRLPLAFEPGVDAGTFTARGRGYALRVGPSGLDLALKGHGLRVRFPGRNPEAAARGVERLPGVVSHFRGNDPSRWRTGLPTFARVRIDGLYPGVALECYGNEGRLEYDFVVAPGADPSRVRVAFDGAEAAEILASGDLELRAGGERLLMRKPVLYQAAGGRRRDVDGRYAWRNGEIGFDLGDYDRALALVIDPVLDYATYLGGTGGEVTRRVAVDAAGNVYVVGRTHSVNFPTTPGAFDTTPDGGGDIFVSKLNSTGTALVYSTYVNGAIGVLSEEAFGVAVDAAGNCYFAGDTNSPDLPTTPGAFQTAYAGNNDAFVGKLNPSGTALVYFTYLGGALSAERATSLAIDAAGNAYVAGYTHSADFPATAGAFDTTHNGNRDAFVAKLNPAGSALVYSTYLGGAGNDEALGLAVAPNGNAYVTGETSSGNYPTANAFDASYDFNLESFVTQLNAAGNGLVFSTYFGQGFLPFVRGQGIAVDAAGNAYVTGISFNGIPTTPGSFGVAFGGGAETDAFAAKFSSTGSLVYSGYLGGAGPESGFDIAVDGAGRAFVTGQWASGTFPATPDALDATPNGADAFLIQIDAAGTGFVYASLIGGSASEAGTGVALDSAGNAYVVGDTASGDFPVTAGALDTGYNGGIDSFLVKTRLSTNQPPVVSVGPPATRVIQRIYGGSVGINDPTSSSWNVTIDFGDGTSTIVNGVTSSPLAFTHAWTSAAGSPYTVTATVVDDQGASGSATVQVTVLTASQGIDALRAKTLALVPTPLASRYATILVQILDRAKAWLSQGNPQMAIAQLRSYASYAARYGSSGTLPSATAQDLVDDANAIIAALQP